MAKQRFGNELHPLYSRWLTMTQRCTNPNHANYPRYGGRGISIAEEFKVFSQYVAYVESLPNSAEGLTIDRIDPDKGYVPGNLRWACRSVQTANQSDSGKGFNKYTGVNYSITHKRWIARVTFKGKCLLSKVCLTEREAVETRNQFIQDNGLPHKISVYVD